MPIYCDIDIERLSTEKFAQLDYNVMGYAFNCHKQIGRLADERVYETALANRLNECQFNCVQQVPIQVSYSGFLKTFLLDLVVSRKGVYELKTVDKLTNEHRAQLLTYLYLLDLPRGKLINFRRQKVESEFVNAPLSRIARTSFTVESDHYCGPPKLPDLTVRMLLDLGTSLCTSLYQEILLHLLGVSGCSNVMLPMSDGKKHLGNQLFQLASATESLKVTCFNNIPKDYGHQLQSLLQFSPLESTHWINIDPKVVTFTTVSKIAKSGSRSKINI